LDQKLLEPFGSRVRCNRCGHVFWVESPADDLNSDTPAPVPSSEKPLPFGEEHREISMKIRRSRKMIWPLGMVLFLLLLAATGRFFYLQYLHPQWSVTDLLSELIFLPADAQGRKEIRLVNYRNYFIENDRVGRVFVIEGEIKNDYPTARQQIKIRGALKKNNNKVAETHEVYAGWTLTPGELDTLSLEEMNRLRAKPADQISKNVRVMPGKTLPFMILFPRPPKDSTHVSIEILGSQKAPSSPPLQSYSGL
jgi:hypothetical protein